MRTGALCLAIPLLCLATGCTYSRAIIGFAKRKPVEASAGNYTVVKPGIKGEASCTYLFGLLSIGDSAVATQAMDRLRESAMASGRSIGLVNFTGDEVMANYFGVVTTRSLSMQADAVELAR